MGGLTGLLIHTNYSFRTLPAVSEVCLACYEEPTTGLGLCIKSLPNQVATYKLTNTEHTHTHTGSLDFTVWNSQEIITIVVTFKVLKHFPVACFKSYLDNFTEKTHICNTHRCHLCSEWQKCLHISNWILEVYIKKENVYSLYSLQECTKTKPKSPKMFTVFSSTANWLVSKHQQWTVVFGSAIRCYNKSRDCMVTWHPEQSQTGYMKFDF